MDGDLEAIRAKRMAELQGASSGGASAASRMPSAPGSAAPGAAGGEDQAAKMAAEEEQMRTIMRQILSNEARERRLVKPERARAIEQLLMRMAQGGQLRGRVSEEQLIDVLDQVEAMEKGQSGAGGSGSGSKSAGKITFTRKSAYDSDDSF
ncbi:hypothetical protein JCM3766R1_005169 [Sporobolomyces carnicolor]